jgi:hypothetical protein
MRKWMLAIAVCLGAGLVWAAGSYQPLNVKTGLWESTWSSTVTGQPPIPPDMLAKMTPEQRARFEAMMSKMAHGTSDTRKSCLTKENLEKDPFNRGDKSCTETVVSSSSHEMNVHEVCTHENSKMDVSVHIVASDSEHVTGIIKSNMTGSGHNMSVDGKLTSKWLAPVCGDVKP